MHITNYFVCCVSNADFKCCNRMLFYNRIFKLFCNEYDRDQVGNLQDVDVRNEISIWNVPLGVQWGITIQIPQLGKPCEKIKYIAIHS